MRKDFLGRGWKFPFQYDSGTGGVKTSQYEENIRECVTLILGTKPGERQMLPEFGCRIHELMFAPNDQGTAQLVKYHVEQALQRWEPRIEVQGVSAWPEVGTGKLQVQVRYKIRTTMSEEEISLLLTAGG